MEPSVPAPLPVAANAADALPDNRPALTQAEVQHTARFDTVIAPVRDYTLPPEILTHIREAAVAITAGDLAKADELKAKVADPAGAKLIHWFRLRSGYGEPAEYRTFLAENPLWPEPQRLIQRLEEAVFTKGGDVAAIKEHFKTAEPKTAAGWAALASAHLIAGDTDKARTLAARAWREPGLAATLEEGFLERFKTLLTETDHKWRLDRFLVDDARWSKDRNERAPAVRRTIALLSKPEQKKAEARLAVFLRTGTAARLMAALPADTSPDWGLAFQRLQLLRRTKKEDEARKLLLSLPADRALLVNPDAWWIERRGSAYEALNAGKPQVAYDIVRDGTHLGANALKDQAFLAGWLALRTLGNAKGAETHFLAFRKAADGPLSRSKAEYWLGRTYEALAEPAKAQVRYKAGAVYFDTLFGQLCREKADPSSRRLEVPPPAAPTPEEIQRFTTLDAAKAAVIARNAGLEAGVVRSFLGHFARAMKSEADVAMAAHLAQASGDNQTMVRIGKHAIVRGFNLGYYAYPVRPFPTYKPLREPPETAILLGIARQESEFHDQTVSGAGARGILQVMPITAKHVCNDYKVKCQIERLLTDKSYNTMMGSAYIGDRLRDFSGSYVLTFSGYNAGPGRTRQWIRAFGDPRDLKIDTLDWVIRIPFEETREYVQKVLSNVQVYRARLGGEATALRVHDDLARAKTKTVPALPAPSAAGAEEPPGTADPADDAKPPEKPKT